MAVYTDQTGRVMTVEHLPTRIISIVPSQTEFLFDLGLRDEVVGITKFCVHPEEWFRSKTRVGGTKQLSMEVIHSLKPDLIIANREENEKAHVDELERSYPVWVSDVKTIDHAYDMMRSVGKITGKSEKAEDIIEGIVQNFQNFQPFQTGEKAVYLIWKDPYMTIGHDTFIHQMMELAGFENVMKDKTRYPVISIEELQDLNIDVLLLPSEPYPFKIKQREELQLLLPSAKILLVDGEIFSWYGSRLKWAASYFNIITNGL